MVNMGKHKLSGSGFQPFSCSDPFCNPI